MKVLQSSLWRGALVVLVGRLEHVVSQQQLRVGADRLHKDQPHRRPLARAPLANLLPAQHGGVCGVKHAANAAAPALLSGLLLVLLESGEGGERVGGQELEPAQQLLPSTHRTSVPQSLTSRRLAGSAAAPPECPLRSPLAAPRRLRLQRRRKRLRSLPGRRHGGASRR